MTDATDRSGVAANDLGRENLPNGTRTLPPRETFAVRIAGRGDLPYIVSLMRANRESVGGLPSPAIEERLARGTVLLGSLNGEPAGYLLYDYRDGVLRVPQACIQYDARRRRYGEILVTELLRRHSGASEVNLRCAADLEANLFWRDMGFTCTATLAGGKRRGRKINSWALWFSPRLISLSEIAVIPAAQKRQDTMYDDSGFLFSTPSGFAEIEQLPKLAWANRKRAA